jgi:hypothetical protein
MRMYPEGKVAVSLPTRIVPSKSKIMKQSSEATTPSGVTLADLPQTSAAEAALLSTLGVTSVTDWPEDLPFINLDGIDLVIQNFEIAARFLITHFNPPPIQLAKLALALDDLKNLRVRSPLLISQFGIVREYDRSDANYVLTMQRLVFEVSSERLEISYSEAQPGDSRCLDYTVWPKEYFRKELNLFDVIEDLHSLSGGDAKLIVHTVGAINFDDSDEM